MLMVFQPNFLNFWIKAIALFILGIPLFINMFSKSKAQDTSGVEDQIYREPVLLHPDAVRRLMSEGNDFRVQSPKHKVLSGLIGFLLIAFVMIVPIDPLLKLAILVPGLVLAWSLANVSASIQEDGVHFRNVTEIFSQKIVPFSEIARAYEFPAQGNEFVVSKKQHLILSLKSGKDIEITAVDSSYVVDGPEKWATEINRQLAN